MSTRVLEAPRSAGGGSWSLRDVAPGRWDGILRASGGVALVSIALTLYSPVPVVADLATLFSLALFINGPYSPLTPLGFEPVLMAYGKLFPPILVAGVGLAAQLLVESVNYHLYDAALRTDALRRARESRLAQRVLGWYGVAPFLTTAVVAFTPLPYWTVRITAPLARYPMSRHLGATAVGRLPRLWLYATLGTLIPASSTAILGTGLGVTIIFLAVGVLRLRRRG